MQEPEKSVTKQEIQASRKTSHLVVRGFRWHRRRSSPSSSPSKEELSDRADGAMDEDAGGSIYDADSGTKDQELIDEAERDTKEVYQHSARPPHIIACSRLKKRRIAILCTSL